MNVIGKSHGMLPHARKKEIDNADNRQTFISSSTLFLQNNASYEQFAKTKAVPLGET
jgi:hypothetical protein